MMTKKIFIALCLFIFTNVFSNDRSVKIYDCFTFFNELEILNIRLNELYNSVDHFVIVESTKTSDGKSKPLYYENNKNLFSKFSNKIIHIVVNNFEDKNIEKAQKNAILKGLIDANDNDIIFISDAEDIVSSKKIEEFANPLLQNKTNLVIGQVRSYKWFLNRWDTEFPFVNALLAIKYKDLKKTSPFEIKKDENTFNLVRDAGWRFSNQGFVKYVMPKLKYSKFTSYSYSKMAKLIVSKGKKCIDSPVDATYPKYIQENLQYFTDHNFIYEDLEKKEMIKTCVLKEKQDTSSRF